MEDAKRKKYTVNVDYTFEVEAESTLEAHQTVAGCVSVNEAQNVRKIGDISIEIRETWKSRQSQHE